MLKCNVLKPFHTSSLYFIFIYVVVNVVYHTKQLQKEIYLITFMYV